MAIQNLLDMSKKDILNLKNYVTNNTLHICVHPLWNAFPYEPPQHPLKLHALLTLYTNEKIEEIQKSMTDFEKYRDIDFLLASENTMLTKQIKKREEYAKSITYFTALTEFFSAYELLNQASYLKQLTEHKQLCILLQPYGFYTNNAPEFIDEFNHHNFIYLETEQEETGNLQKPQYQTIEFNKLERHQFEEHHKLDKLDELYNLLNITKINLFGGNIHECLYSGQKSLLHAEQKNIHTISDVSIGNMDLKKTVFLTYNSTSLLTNIGDDKNNKLNNLKNQLLEHTEDFSTLNKAIDKPWEEQLQIFQMYKNIIQIFNQIKPLYMYKHINVISLENS